MYKLIKSFIMLLLCSNPVTAALAEMWSLIEFLLNILLKIFVVFPLYLFELLLNFLKTFLEGLFSSLGNPQEIINKCKITIVSITSKTMETCTNSSRIRPVIEKISKQSKKNNT